MGFDRTSREHCLGAIAVGCLVAGCLGEAGPDEGTTADIGQSVQALFDTRSAHNNGSSAKATCTVFTFGERIADDNAEIDCDITDGASDSHSVYVDWSQDGFGAVRLTNHNGANSTVNRTDARVNRDASFGVIRWKVCTDVQLGGDNCSDVQSYTLH